MVCTCSGVDVADCERAGVLGDDSGKCRNCLHAHGRDAHRECGVARSDQHRRLPARASERRLSRQSCRPGTYSSVDLVELARSAACQTIFDWTGFAIRSDWTGFVILMVVCLCLQANTHDCTAHSALWTPGSNDIRPLFVYTDTWCSSGQFDANGQLVQTGGDADGLSKVQYFLNRRSGISCKLRESDSLYAT